MTTPILPQRIEAATGLTEDYAAYWQNRPLERALDAKTAVQVVGKRCVYLNEYRIAGSKPYYSENLPNQRFETTVRDALAAFPDAVLRAALKERKESRAYFKRWQDAAALRAKDQADG